MGDLSVGEGRICLVVLSPFNDRLLFRFCVLGLFQELSLFILWGHTEPRDKIGSIKWAGKDLAA